jgi:hypothetical protein
MSTREKALADENHRMRKLRLMVDATAGVIRSQPLTRQEAEVAVEYLRERALALFPDKGEVFDLLYRARFRRLIEQRFGP